MKRVLHVLLAVFFILAALSIVMIFFQALPIEQSTLAMDWYGLWNGIRGGRVEYGDAGTGLRIPPWSVLFILPLGWLPFRTGWGILAFVTLGILLTSVPRGADRVKFYAGAILLLCSYPSLRTIADGNLEFLVLAGCLLIGWGFSARNTASLVAGILLAASKVQETWLLLFLLPFYSLPRMGLRKCLAVLAGCMALAVPALLWKGREWIESILRMEARGSIMDSSMWAAAGRLSVPFPAAAIFGVILLGVTILLARNADGGIPRERMGLLIAASLLLAPYAAANNVLTVVALGVIPLFMVSPVIGLLMLALVNLPFAFLNARDAMVQASALYWTFVLFMLWLVFAIRAAFLCQRADCIRPANASLQDVE